MLSAFFENFHISWREILDIALVTYVFYRALLLIHGTRAVSVLHGFLLILIVYYLSGVFGLDTLHWLLTNFLSSIFLVIIILFQADIRKALSTVGAGGFFRRRPREAMSEEVLDECVLAVTGMARSKTGALIVFERRVPLGDYIQKGVELSAKLTKELLCTIFFPDTPLHDGAVIVRGSRVAAAGCFLPLSDDMNLARELGTRHRAALGVSTVSDSVTIVVSEETGAISLARDGKLVRYIDAKALHDILEQLFLQKNTAPFFWTKRREKNDKA